MRLATTRRFRVGVPLLSLALLAGCGTTAAPTASVPTSTSANGGPASATSPKPTPDPKLFVTVGGSYPVTPDGRELAIRCWGRGSPTVILETGGPMGGIDIFSYHDAFTRPIAATTRVCTYDRAGTGQSDPAPNQKREAEDVANDLQALLAAAAVHPPYVFVGWSFGGYTLTYYAHVHPQGVAGVVLIDVAAPNAKLTEQTSPEIVWNYPDNVEHLDALYGFEHRFALHPSTFNVPLRDIVATNGQSSVKDQQYWLPLSPSSSLIELQGSHDLPLDQPAACAAEVLKMVEAARATAS